MARGAILFVLWGCGGGGQTPPDPLADLRVEVTAPTMVEANANVDYAITVTNDGPEDATDLIVTHTMTAGFLQTIQGGPDLRCVQPRFNETSCTLDTLIAGESESITIVASGPGTGPFASTTQAFADGVDPDPINNSQIHTTDVIARADLQLISNGFPSTAPPTSPVTYDTFAINNGPSVAANATLVIQPTGGLVLDGIDGLPGWVCSGGPTRTCTIAVLNGGVHQFVAFGTAPAQAGEINLVITLNAETLDPFPVDNMMTLTTLVQ